MGKPYEPKPGEIAGFEIIGYRQPDGTVKIPNEDAEAVLDFPEEVRVCGATYTLEGVNKNDEDGTMPDDHGGKYIEWGLYA